MTRRQVLRGVLMAAGLAVLSPTAVGQGILQNLPSVQATFSPDTVLRGDSSTLSLRLVNPPATGTDLFVTGQLRLGALSLIGALNSTCATDGSPVVAPGADGLALTIPFLVLGPGQGCTISFRVTSGVVGSYRVPASTPVFGNSFLGTGAAATFAIVSDTLNVVDGPRISLSPVEIDFSFVPVGSVSPAQVVRATNLGNLPLTIGTVNAIGDFGFASDCGGSQLAPGESCAASVTFAPLRLGQSVGALSFASNDPARPSASVTLFGNGTPAPNPLDVRPARLDFPDTFVGLESAPLTVTLSNVSASSVLLSGARADSSEFSAASDCPTTLAPGESCTVFARFRPQSVGPVAGSLRFDTEPANAASAVPMAGTGLVPPARLRLTPAESVFLEQLVGSTSDEVAFQLINDGERSATIARIFTTGDFAVSFIGACSELGPGASCPIGVRFTPSVAGERAGTLVVDAPPSSQPVVARLAGLGQLIPTPRLELSATETGFGSTWVGSRSLARITARNAGTGPLALRAISTLPPFRLAASTCAATLAPKAACTLDVAFEPTARGSYVGSVIIDTDTPPGSQSAGLSGSGCSLVITGRGASTGC